MNVSSWCIRNPIPALMLFVLLSFFGGVLFQLDLFFADFAVFLLGFETFGLAF